MLILFLCLPSSFLFFSHICRFVYSLSRKIQHNRFGGRVKQEPKRNTTESQDSGMFLVFFLLLFFIRLHHVGTVFFWCNQACHSREWCIQVLVIQGYLGRAVRSLREATKHPVCSRLPGSTTSLDFIEKQWVFILLCLYPSYNHLQSPDNIKNIIYFHLLNLMLLV